MPVTVTATKIGTLKSVVRAQAVSAGTAGATLDTLTINHGLGKTPHTITPTVRTLITTASGNGPVIIVQSFDATKVVLQIQGGGVGSTNILMDCVVSFEHSIVQ
jgi:hypothetical protein